MLCYTYLKSQNGYGIVWLTKVRELVIRKDLHSQKFNLIALYQSPNDSEVIFSSLDREEVDRELEQILSKICVNLKDTQKRLETIRAEREAALKKAKEDEIARAKAEKEAEVQRLQRELQELIK